jgi:hypothetical protein
MARGRALSRINSMLLVFMVTLTLP